MIRRWVHKADAHLGDHAAGNPCTTFSFGFPFGAGNRIFAEYCATRGHCITGILTGWIILTRVFLDRVNYSTDLWLLSIMKPLRGWGCLQRKVSVLPQFRFLFLESSRRHQGESLVLGVTNRSQLAADRTFVVGATGTAGPS